jgi:hypothetical protein
MQQSGSIVVDNRHARTLRLNQVHDRDGRYGTLPFRGHRRPLCGYAEFPKAVHAPKHECHAGLKEWAADGLRIDPRSVNRGQNL